MQVVSLTRRRRASFSEASTDLQHLPTLMDNVLFDMDGTTDPSSSDSDSIPRNRMQAPLVERQQISVVKNSKEDVKCDRAKSSPLIQQKENSFNQQHTTSGGGENRSRRRPPIKSKEVAPLKRWV